jgi:sec-independent protein translocase protein TatC
MDVPWPNASGRLRAVARNKRKKMTVQSPHPPRTRQPDPKYMTFVEHLQELRVRLIISILAIAVGSVAGWFLAPHILDLLVAPIRHYFGKNLVTPTIYGAFTVQLKLAIEIGFVFALPVTVYQLWGFVAPAFGQAANRWAPIWIISAIGLFLLGGVTGYLVVPLAIRFFAGFQGQITVLPFASEYIGFISLILLVFGISFELPLVLVSLSAIGITSSRWLASKRAFAFFGIFAFSTIVTPGADWISPLILGGILYVLYELSILVSRLIGK